MNLRRLFALLCACFTLAATAGDTVSVGQLPQEARETLHSIDQGGPFTYRRDGVVFNNFEHRLPSRARGYYHEYTVPTPGRRDRGARRIITGGSPPVEFHYTDNHYRSFRKIQR